MIIDIDKKIEGFGDGTPNIGKVGAYVKIEFDTGHKLSMYVDEIDVTIKTDIVSQGEGIPMIGDKHLTLSGTNRAQIGAQNV